MNNLRICPTNDGKLISIASVDELPARIREELTGSAARLNELLVTGQVGLSDIDMGPLDLPDLEEVRGNVPCNANRIEKHWWGVTAYLNDDLLMNVSLGTVPATGVAASLGGGPIALIVGAAVIASIMALSAACGKCGVILEVTWAGVPKKIKSRN